MSKSAEVSREQFDAQTVKTVYKKGNTITTVRSTFSGEESLESILMRAIQRKLRTTFTADAEED